MNYKIFLKIKAAIKTILKKVLSQLKQSKTIPTQTIHQPEKQDSLISTKGLNFGYTDNELTISNSDLKEIDLKVFVSQFLDCELVKVEKCTNVNIDTIAQLGVDYAVIDSTGVYQKSNISCGIISFIDGFTQVSKVKFR